MKPVKEMDSAPAGTTLEDANPCSLTLHAVARQAYDTLACGIVLQDACGRMYANPAARRMLGLAGGPTASAVLAFSRNAIADDGSQLAPEDLPMAIALRTGLAQTNRVIGILRHDGERRWLQADSVPWPGQAGEAPRVVTSFVDVTDRQRTEAKQAREPLTTTEERYRTIVETAIEGIWVIDAAGRTSFANRRMAELLGCTVDDMQGRSLLDFTDAEGRAIAETNIERRRRGVSEEHEFKFVRADGGILWSVVSANPLFDANANYRGALAMVTDVTERRRLREMRRRSAELEQENRRVEEASRLKSEFVANMSHELRTPLNGIIGFSELMYDGKVGALSPQHKQFVGHILKSGEHLLHLINDVLDLAKVEAGKLEFHPARVSLSKLVEEVVDTLEPLAQAKALDVRVQIDSTLDDLFIDGARLKQILYNYLSNALKFTPEDGDVALRCIREGPGELRIEVHDSGVGICSDDIGRLFGAFEQLNAGLNKREQGTGLGLALTKRLVEAMGGQVGVSSLIGGGSTFYAVLPLKTAA